VGAGVTRGKDGRGSQRGHAAETVGRGKPKSGRAGRFSLNLAGWLALFALAGLIPVALRAFGVIGWPWVLVLSPFTTAGVLFTLTVGWTVVSPVVFAWRDRGAAVTPAPEQLGVPISAERGDLRILGQYPEILAALCHGFRMLRLQPIVLGKPVTDPWGVYAAALLASPAELEVLALLARKHAQRSAGLGRKALNRTPSDADVMKQAVRQFQRCAANVVQGRGNPDCSFEHVTVVFGTRSPNRDAHLKSMAPRVRALLERLYPQLATAGLDDGSAVRYDDWQQHAADDRRELSRLRKEERRLEARIGELDNELLAANARTEQMRAEADAMRAQARTEAARENEEYTRQLRTALDVARHEHARELHRLNTEQDRLLATVESLSAERDVLERLLFADQEEADADAAEPDTRHLAGVRVLLVGGNPGHVPPIKEHVEQHGIQLLHAESVAAQLVAGSDLVVLWTRFMTHATYFAVKRECRARNVPYCHWVRTSPVSLVRTISAAVSAL
jgi:hypothetical protein